MMMTTTTASGWTRTSRPTFDGSTQNWVSGIFSGAGAFLSELFPNEIRGSGQGFCYNFGRGIGALFPFLVGWLSTSTTLANAIAIFAVAAYGVFFIAAFALPETRGRVLHADA